MTQVFWNRESTDTKEFQFLIQVKGKTDGEIKECHRRRLYELSIKSQGEMLQLEELNREQRQWVETKMNATSWIGRSFT